MSSESESPVLIDHSAGGSISGDLGVVFTDPPSPQADEPSPTNSKLHDHDDPPVIVGMACRLPGDIGSPSELWDFIIQQKSASGPVPPERYNIKGFYHPDGGNRSGLTNVPGGYFINEDVRNFDNGFFGISNVEATYLDPQQRKLLEISYECLQSAGISSSYSSSDILNIILGALTPIHNEI
jgi:acyl transferase domain-containing protein